MLMQWFLRKGQGSTLANIIYFAGFVAARLEVLLYGQVLGTF